MTPRPTIAPGQVWRRPNGRHVRVAFVSNTHAELWPVLLFVGLGSGRMSWGCACDRRDSTKLLSAIGGRGWELVAEGVRDPREAT